MALASGTRIAHLDTRLLGAGDLAKCIAPALQLALRRAQDPGFLARIRSVARAAAKKSWQRSITLIAVDLRLRRRPDQRSSWNIDLRICRTYQARPDSFRRSTAIAKQTEALRPRTVGHRPSRPEARKYQAARRRHDQGAGLRCESDRRRRWAGRAAAGRGGHRELADDHESGRDDRRRDSGCCLRRPAGEGQARRQARRIWHLAACFTKCCCARRSPADVSDTLASVLCRMSITPACRRAPRVC